MGVIRAAYFIALASAAWAVIHGPTVLKSEAFKRAAPLLKSRKCFEQPGFASYQWYNGAPVLPPAVDSINCVLNSLFISSTHSEAAVLFMKTFGPLFISAILIVTYEAARPAYRRANILVGPLARAPNLFLFAGQLLAAGCSTPIHMIFTALAAPAGPAAPPSGEHVWSVLLSTVVGFLGVWSYVKATDMSYLALTIWQPFPVYTAVLGLIFPPVLRAAGFGSLRKAGIVAIAVLGTAASVQGHIELVRAALPAVKDTLVNVFLLGPAPADPTLTYGSHLLFVWDCAFVYATVTSLVVATAGSLGTLGAILGLTAVAGPGAGVILPWAVRELNAADKADARRRS